MMSAILLALPAITRAQMVSTSASSSAGDGGSNGNSQTNADTAPVPGPSSHTAQASYSSDQPSPYADWQQSSSSSASASASDGKLHLNAQAQAGISPAYGGYLDENYQYHMFNSPLTPSASSTASGSIVETIQITSSTLAIGTPVDLAVGTTLDCSITSPASGSADAVATLQFFHQNGDNYLDDSNNNLFGDIEQHYSYNVLSHSMDQNSDTLHAAVGDLITVEFDASVDVTANSAWMFPNSTGSADAGNTAYFSLDPITPGADFAIVSAPIPEPTSLALIAMAALPLMHRRRRPC